MGLKNWCRRRRERRRVARARERSVERSRALARVATRELARGRGVDDSARARLGLREGRGVLEKEKGGNVPVDQGEHRKCFTDRKNALDYQNSYLVYTNQY